MLKNLKKLIIIAIIGSLALPNLATVVLAAEEANETLLIVEEWDPQAPLPLPENPQTKALEIFDFLVEAGADTATLSWAASREAEAFFTWGENQNLTGEVEQNLGKGLNFKVHLQNLSPEKKYYFKIIMRASDGSSFISPVYNFTTKSAHEAVEIPNVSNFTARAEKGKIVLSWDKPVWKDLMAIRVIRSETFYPLHIRDGVEVYNDNGNGFEDKQIKPGTRYYYAVFVYDNSGQYSSGAALSVVSWIGEKPVISDEDETEKELPVVDLPEKEKEILNQTKEKIKIFVLDEKVKIEKEEGERTEHVITKGEVIFKIEKKDLIKEVKSILLFIEPETATKKNEREVYLMHFDPKDENYTAKIKMPKTPGQYRAKFSYFGTEKARLGESEKIVSVVERGQVNGKSSSGKIKALGGAKITVFELLSGEWQEWRGENYGQDNPIMVSKSGEYELFLPQGEYKLQVEKKGYEKFESSPFKTNGGPANMNLELNQQAGFLAKMIVGISSISLIAKNKISAGAQFIAKTFAALVNSAKSIIKNIYHSIFKIIYNIKNISSNIFKNIIFGIKNITINIALKIKNIILNIFNSAINISKNIITGAKNIIKNIISNSVNMISAGINNIKNIFSKIISGVKNISLNIISSVKNISVYLKNQILSAGKFLVNSFVSSVRGIKYIAINIFNSAINISKNIISGVKNITLSLAREIKNITLKIISSAKNIIINTAQKIKNISVIAINNIKNISFNIFSSVKASAIGVKVMAVDAGDKAMNFSKDQLVRGNNFIKTFSGDLVF